MKLEMKTKVQYIAETREFLIDGKVVKEETLTEQERIELKKQAKAAEFLIGSFNCAKGNLII